MKDLFRHVAVYVGDKWYAVGVELLGGVPQLDAIKTNYSGDVNKCTTEMLKLWLQRIPHASWNQLIEAFKKPHIGLGDLASKIEGMFKGM